MSDKATLLFVDDEERVLRSLKALFGQKYHVLTTEHGAKAIELLKAEPVHVLISDQRMPQMTGIEVLREARGISPGTVRILLTGYSDLTAIVGSINDGEVFRYVNKPWNTDELKAIIEQAVGFADLTPPSTEPAPTPSVEAVELLVIEPDHQSYQGVESCLAEKYKAHWASTLEEAFACLSEYHIALVITEARLHGEDISSALRALKQAHPGIVTLVYTDIQDNVSLMDLINEGQIYRFIPKPVRPGLLERNLNAALQHYHTLQRNPRLLKMREAEPPPHAEPRDANPSTFSSKITDYLSKIKSRAGKKS